MPKIMPTASCVRGPVAFFAGREEPRLRDMINDPIIQRLMASDGVRLDHLMDVIADTKEKLSRR
jgi:hypothetical protein